MSQETPGSIQLSSLKGNEGFQGRMSDIKDRFDGIRTKRVVAYIIDIACIAGITAIATIAAFILGALSFGALTPILSLALALIPIAYHTFTIGSAKNATIGMQIMGVEVVLEDGKGPDYLMAFFHSGLFYATMTLTSTLILLVSLFNDKGKLLHDYLTSSTVRLRED